MSDITLSNQQFQALISAAKAGDRYANERSKNNRQEHKGAKSGANYVPPQVDHKTGEITKNAYVHGWFHRRNTGMVSVIAFPYEGKKTKTEDTRKSKTGKVYRKWVCKITYRDTGIEKVRPCLYLPDDNRVFITSENMAIVPKGNHGKGWFGFLSRKK